MSDTKYFDALLANRRLREERDSLREQLVHFGELHGAEHRAITAERDRLREALEKIDSLPDYAPVQSAQDIARAALAKEAGK